MLEYGWFSEMLWNNGILKVLIAFLILLSMFLSLCKHLILLREANERERDLRARRCACYTRLSPTDGRAKNWTPFDGLPPACTQCMAQNREGCRLLVEACNGFDPATDTGTEEGVADGYVDNIAEDWN